MAWPRPVLRGAGQGQTARVEIGSGKGTSLARLPGRAGRWLQGPFAVVLPLVALSYHAAPGILSHVCDKISHNMGAENRVYNLVNQ